MKTLVFQRCPHCGDTASDKRVVDSRQDGKGEAIRRRRECGACGGRFNTLEVLSEAVGVRSEAVTESAIIAELEAMLAKFRPPK